MQVAQIITEQEQVTNSRELARSFGNNADSNWEWVRIANYFVTTKNIWSGSLGDDRGEIDGRMNQINRQIGANMSERLTPIRWNTFAARYGMNTDATNPSWQDIYNHLAPHKDFDLPEAFNVAGTGAGAGLQVNSTNELSYEISTWVQTDRTQFDRSQLIEYVNAWYTECIRNRRPELFGRWIGARENPNDPNSPRVNRAYRHWEDLISRLLGEIETNGPMTKENVDSYLYAWLTASDNAFAAHQRRNP